jgi:S1-C subfamily serine protease
MNVVNLTDQIRQQAGIAQGQKGVVVVGLVDQSTPAAIAGFQPGDVITAVNGKTVQTMLDFYRALGDSTKNVTFKLMRDGTEVSIGL